MFYNIKLLISAFLHYGKPILCIFVSLLFSKHKLMINYCTYIDIPKSALDITYEERLMFLGSCFADNIGLKMTEHRFNVNVNPFGVLYNPLSVALGCKRMLKPELFAEESLFYHNGLYHNFMHHGKFSNASAIDCLAGMNVSLNSAAAYFQNTSCLIITFGTAYVYRFKDSGQVVANCHKLPAAQFVRELLTVEQIVDEWSVLLENIRVKNPLLKVIFTVSPIRHWKEGAHFNQISKAILLLAERALADKYPDWVFYFPAYELMMDELRDYRFYADDMLHPSKVAIDYIWERFRDTYMDAATKDVLKEVEDINRALSHRPINPSTEAHKQFLIQTLLKIQRLQDKYPYICLSKEEKEIANKLQK